MNTMKYLRVVYLSFFGLICSLFPLQVVAQTEADKSVFKHFGVIGGIVVALLLILLMVFLMSSRISGLIKKAKASRREKEQAVIRKELGELEGKELDNLLEKRKEALLYKLRGDELSGTEQPADEKGIISQTSTKMEIPFVSEKKYLREALKVDSGLKRLVLAFIGMSAFWLVFGTTVGGYIAFKFVAPDLDHISWLSFGRLCPVHTNTVFWGWVSLAMLGLGYFVIPRTSNSKLYSLKLGWWAFGLINASV